MKLPWNVESFLSNFVSNSADLMNDFGKKNIGIVNMKINVPNTIKPIHYNEKQNQKIDSISFKNSPPLSMFQHTQAPIHLGSWLSNWGGTWIGLNWKKKNVFYEWNIQQIIMILT